MTDDKGRNIADRMKWSIAKHLRKIKNRLGENDLPKPISHQPLEIVTSVGLHLVTKDPAETAKNLANFELTSQTMRNSIAGNLKNYRNTLKIIIPEARAAFDTVLPVSRDYGRNEDRLKKVAPIIKFQNDARKRRVVDVVASLKGGESADYLADTLNTLSPHVRYFKGAMRLQLINKAIACLTDDQISEMGKYNAANLLTAAISHTGGAEPKVVFDALRNRPDLAEILENTEINRLAALRYQGFPSLISGFGVEASSPAKTVLEKLNELKQERDLAIAKSQDIYALSAKGRFSKALDDMHEEAWSELAQSHGRDIGQIGDTKAEWIISRQIEIDKPDNEQMEPVRSSRSNIATPVDARSEMIKARQGRSSIGRG